MELFSEEVAVLPFPNVPQLPFWNNDTRELLFAGQIAKRFRQGAVNQVTVLKTFQDDNWASRIDDPLPPDEKVDRVERLHDTVRRLNRQENPLLQFFCDGTGQGVIWKVREPSKK